MPRRCGRSPCNSPSSATHRHRQRREKQPVSAQRIGRNFGSSPGRSPRRRRCWRESRQEALGSQQSRAETTAVVESRPLARTTFRSGPGRAGDPTPRPRREPLGHDPARPPMKRPYKRNRKPRSPVPMPPEARAKISAANRRRWQASRDGTGPKMGRDRQMSRNAAARLRYARRAGKIVRTEKRSAEESRRAEPEPRS